MERQVRERTAEVERLQRENEELRAKEAVLGRVVNGSQQQVRDYALTAGCVWVGGWVGAAMHGGMQVEQRCNQQLGGDAFGNAAAGGHVSALPTNLTSPHPFQTHALCAMLSLQIEVLQQLRNLQLPARPAQPAAWSPHPQADNMDQLRPLPSMASSCCLPDPSQLCKASTPEGLAVIGGAAGGRSPNAASTCRGDDGNAVTGDLDDEGDDAWVTNELRKFPPGSMEGFEAVYHVIGVLPQQPVPEVVLTAIRANYKARLFDVAQVRAQLPAAPVSCAPCFEQQVAGRLPYSTALFTILLMFAKSRKQRAVRLVGSSTTSDSSTASDSSTTSVPTCVCGSTLESQPYPPPHL